MTASEGIAAPASPLIGITMGDPAGVGPEIVINALSDPRVRKSGLRCIVVGAAGVLEQTARHVGIDIEIRSVTNLSSVVAESGIVSVYPVSGLDPKDVVPGEVDPACGKAAADFVRQAVALAMNGHIDSIASAPANKEAMRRAGLHHAGQTELIAELTRTTRFTTVLVSGKLRVFLHSTHVSLRRAIELVEADRLEATIRRADEALTELFGIEEPIVAVAGLNPHAGDGGLFGTEEIEIIRPVVAKLVAEGRRVVGPLPADGLFLAAEPGAYDGLVSLYHDQAIVPLKRAGFVATVAGLPIIRTTTGHGTAFDIAGKGVADPELMIRSILLAGALASVRMHRQKTT